jgi:hypothetical protein
MSSKLLIQIDSFDFNKSKENTFIETESFVIRRNNKLYTITSHNFLPIKHNIINDKTTFSICIHSNWNELLILKSDEISKETKIFKKISTKLPNIGSILFIKNEKAIVHEFCFYNFGFLPKYPEIVYIKIKNDSPGKILSGTPLYDSREKIMGLVSFSDENYIYCLPGYYIIKTFVKKNKIQLPNNLDELVKINRYLVKNDMVYNPYLGLNIPVSSYFLLESNRKIDLTLINNDDESVYISSDVNFREYKSNELILNSRKLVRNNNYYKITSGTIHLLKKIYPDLCSTLFQFLNGKKNINDIKFKLKNGGINMKY